MLELKSTRYFLAAWYVSWGERNNTTMCVYQEGYDPPDAWRALIRERRDNGEKSLERYARLGFQAPTEDAVEYVVGKILQNIVEMKQATTFDVIRVQGDGNRFRELIREKAPFWLDPGAYDPTDEVEEREAPERISEDARPGEAQVEMPSFMARDDWGQG